MPRRRPLERPWRPKFEVPDDIDPRAVRQSLRKTQEGFAALIGVSLRTVQAWERVHWMRLGPGEVSENNSRWKASRRRPTGAARVLLAMIQRDPWIVFDCLTGQLSPDRG
jgi:DNA-binding transcriptional regulator YiaG